jgi:hypothetical protein
MKCKNFIVRIVLFYSVVALIAISNIGCKDRYQEGYDVGYAEGFSQAKIDAEKRCIDSLEEERSSCLDRSYSSGSHSGYSTEVCGGGGVTANGKHYEGGKTGCVRVYSDGRVVRY